MKMGDQESIRNGSNRNGRLSKKPKQKKVPQRGLGVAQLEKIRLEEEVKNDAANLPSLAITPHPSAIPFPRHNRPNPLSYDNLRGHVPCNPHMNLRHRSIGTVFPSPPNNAGAGLNLLSCTYTQELDKSKRFPQNPNPPYEPRMLMSPFGLILCENRQLSSSSVVNDAAENSSSAVLNSQTEPPSNQSPYGTYRSVQPDEVEKAYTTVGTKRPCPFFLQNPSNTLLHCKFNPFMVQENSTPHSNSGLLVIKGNFSFRDGTPHSISISNSHYTKDNRAENMTSDYDFLELAPPAIMPLFPSSKSKQAISFPHTYQAELLNHDSTSSNVHTLGSDPQAQQQSFYIFFPEPNIPGYGQSTVMTGHQSHETDEEDHVDLNLKL